MKIGIFLTLAITLPVMSADIPQMKEMAQEAGITHSYTGDFEFFVGGGVASFDCNDDHKSDVFLAGGSSPAQLFINHTPVGGALAFEAAPLDQELLSVSGAYPINIDNDAFVDLVVLRVGENKILKGLGNCKFAEANEEFGFDGGNEWTTGFSAIWEKDAKYPTLAFANYIDQEAPDAPWGTCEDNVLARPDENGKYTKLEPLSPSFCSLSILFTDWNNEGKYDLRVTNDRQYYRGGKEQLWTLNDGGKPTEYGLDQGWQKLVIWGMGIAEGDLDGDGRPEYALSSMGDTMLQGIDEDAPKEAPQYRDLAFEKGTTAHRPYVGDEGKPSTGWHTQFADFNNDARSDLFIAKGNVQAMPDFAAMDPDNMLLSQFDGKFVEAGHVAGIDLDRRGRGAVVDDFNNDGMLDLLVVNREANVSLFQNMGVKTSWGNAPLGNFIDIELNNGEVNPDAIGARIEVKTGTLTQIQTVHVGGGHASGQNGFIHFGLGVAERAEIRVRWPDGETSQFYRAFANNHIVIERSKDEPQYWYAQ